MWLQTWTHMTTCCHVTAVFVQLSKLARRVSSSQLVLDVWVWVSSLNLCALILVVKSAAESSLIWWMCEAVNNCRAEHKLWHSVCFFYCPEFFLRLLPAVWSRQENDLQISNMHSTTFSTISDLDCNFQSIKWPLSIPAVKRDVVILLDQQSKSQID